MMTIYSMYRSLTMYSLLKFKESFRDFKNHMECPNFEMQFWQFKCQDISDLLKLKGPSEDSVLL